MQPDILGIDGKLPFIQQVEHYTCVPHCLWMVIEKIKEKLSRHNIKDFTTEEIASIVKSMPGLATSYNDIRHLNMVLEDYTPIISFKPNYGFNWDDILIELKQKKPVIAYLKGHRNHRLAHAVVVTHFNQKTDQVTYTDPIHGETTKYITDFMTYWGNAANVLYLVEVGKIIQTSLDEISGEKKNDVQ